MFKFRITLEDVIVEAEDESDAYEKAKEAIQEYTPSDLIGDINKVEDSNTERNPDKFINYYKCSECGEEWDDSWDCICNDRCPRCNLEIEPYRSEDILI